MLSPLHITVAYRHFFPLRRQGPDELLTMQVCRQFGDGDLTVCGSRLASSMFDIFGGDRAVKSS